MDRTLIISENRKCGEGLPEGQQKNTIYSKKATFPQHKRKKEKKKSSQQAHCQFQTQHLTKPTKQNQTQRAKKVLTGGKHVNGQRDRTKSGKICIRIGYTDNTLMNE